MGRSGGLVHPQATRRGLDFGTWRLAKRGLQLIQKETGNFELSAFPGLILKESYWRWPQRNLQGNAIDFFVHVLKLSFHDAMLQIIGP